MERNKLLVPRGRDRWVSGLPWWGWLAFAAAVVAASALNAAYGFVP